ncbi:hypothetical protein HanPI659440_Chr12g0458631 [Helianthus annuus]|nr:hypothetical protein HanPI659440_Chr12g0458631 [Helianthus annuus]
MRNPALFFFLVDEICEVSDLVEVIEVCGTDANDVVAAKSVVTVLRDDVDEEDGESGGSRELETSSYSDCG